MAWIENKSGIDNIDELFKFFNIPNDKVSILLKNYIQEAKWENIKDISDFEIFDEKRKRVFSGCWMDSMRCESEKIYMARKQLSYERYNYCFIKCRGDDYFASYFSDYEQNEGIRNTQRLLYALKANSEGKITVLVDKYKKYSIYHFWSKLPTAEDYFFRYIGWPLCGIDNTKNEFVFHNDCCAMVEKIISNLEMNVEVKHYE